MDCALQLTFRCSRRH